MATITGNFLSHYAIGSTQAFSASSLLGMIAHYAALRRLETVRNASAIDKPIGLSGGIGSAT
jgi:hypothetical protein